tara:strand:+ start:215 stop:493 length:279 start_codon:yes stop_codon:yes gene_type:complete
MTTNNQHSINSFQEISGEIGLISDEANEPIVGNGVELIRSDRRRDPQERFEEKQTRKSAMDAKCWDCCCQQREEIRLCSMVECSLHAFRPYK